jgi:hypothetical protein
MTVFLSCKCGRMKDTFARGFSDGNPKTPQAFEKA